MMKRGKPPRRQDAKRVSFSLASWRLGGFLTLLACRGQAQGDAGVDAAVDAPPSWLGDAGLVTRAPVQIPLRQMCGIASNPGDFPLGTDNASEALRQGYFDSLKTLGATMIRRDFSWPDIEAVQGTFDFSKYDVLVSESLAAGVKLLGTFDYGIAWANAQSNGNNEYPPTNPQDYANYAAATAMHYAGQVDAWEIWNEENNGLRFWYPTLSGDPVAYGALLEASYVSIKAAAPSAEVLLGGTVFTPQIIEGGIPFLEDAYAAHPDLATHFDIAGIHTYASYPPQNAPEVGVILDPPLADKIAMHAWLLQRNNASSTPIWITEIGWPVYGVVDEPTQARFTVRATLIAAGAGASAIFWYVLRDGPNPTAFPPEDAFGLLHNDDTPKVVFGALTNMLTVLGNLSAMATAPPITGLADDAQAVVFGGSKTVVAVWSVTSMAEVTWTGPPATVIDELGTSQTPIATGAPLQVTPDVTYVVE